MCGRKPRVISPSGSGQRRDRALVTTRRNNRGVNLIGGGTGAPRAADRRAGRSERRKAAQRLNAATAAT